jgi:hypothetical protein
VGFVGFFKFVRHEDLQVSGVLVFIGFVTEVKLEGLEKVLHFDLKVVEGAFDYFDFV